MADQWKHFEAEAASWFGCGRAWANSGARLDFPRPDQMVWAPAVGQCKNVQKLSLNELTALAMEMEAFGKQQHPGKLGVVCVKSRQGRGKKTAPLVVMTADMWIWLLEHPDYLTAIAARRRGQQEHGDGGENHSA